MGETLAGTLHRQRVTTQLQTSEAHNQALLETIPDVITHMNRDGRYLKMVRSLTMRNLIPEGVNPIGHTLYDYLPYDIAYRQHQAIETASPPIALTAMSKLSTWRDSYSTRKSASFPVERTQPSS